MNFDVRRYNRGAWDAEVERGNPWTVPVSPEIIRRAREGDWEVVLTPLKAVPRDWFPPLAGLSVLGLAASGGQQAPILAAAGARDTVLDNSPAQLAQDRAVAERDGLDLTLVEGDMANLGAFASESFDLVFHPCSNCFVPDIVPVWREAFRVLRPGGVLLAGFVNPVAFLFDDVDQSARHASVRLAGSEHAKRWKSANLLKPEYACDQAATCERQATGECGFTHDDAYNACISGL